MARVSHRSILTECFKNLHDNFDCDEMIADLFSANVITKEQKATLQLKDKTRYNKVDLLIEYLQDADQDVYIKFLDCLHQLGDTYLLHRDFLQNAEIRKCIINDYIPPPLIQYSHD